MNDLDWKGDLQQWLTRRRGISLELAASIVTFFEVAFKYTRCPQQAWFGVHPSRVSLVVGGIYLAAVQRSGEDQRFWFLANGYCGRCNNPAPFIRRAGNSPYLGVHHTEPLADGGKDTVANAEALCPNCHRRAYHG